MKFPAPLDPGFQPAALFTRHYVKTARASGKSEPLVIGVEREHGLLSRVETEVKPVTDAETLRYVERLVKFLLWARGGWRIWIGGRREIGEHIGRVYSQSRGSQSTEGQPRPLTEPPLAGGRGARSFDADLMSRVYERPFEVTVTSANEVPAEKEMSANLGGHLDGCRLGFDLGASDYKIAAVKDGDVVFSAEVPWNPKDQADPSYHFEHLNSGLRKAAAHLPRVDGIGGSSAGVIVDNKIMVASLFRAVPADRFAMAKNIFLRLRDEWKVPVEVANDGDVTALAGAMTLKKSGLLGLAMGSSQAAGFLNSEGGMTGWLSELAFAPVDYNPSAAADEWSGDTGVGALYFSQQAVNKLLPAAKIQLPAEMGLPERLKEVQSLMAGGDARTAKIYETIGVYLGYTIPHYADFYDFQHLLILGRVTTGQGGDIVLGTAREVLLREFPDVAEKIQLHVPEEKSRRIGQAVAAASLPAITGLTGFDRAGGMTNDE